MHFVERNFILSIGMLYSAGKDIFCICCLPAFCRGNVITFPSIFSVDAESQSITRCFGANWHWYSLWAHESGVLIMHALMCLKLSLLQNQLKLQSVVLCGCCVIVGLCSGDKLLPNNGGSGWRVCVSKRLGGGIQLYATYTYAYR